MQGKAECLITVVILNDNIGYSRGMRILVVIQALACVMDDQAVPAMLLETFNCLASLTKRDSHIFLLSRRGDSIRAGATLVWDDALCHLLRRVRRERSLFLKLLRRCAAA